MVGKDLGKPCGLSSSWRSEPACSGTRSHRGVWDSGYSAARVGAYSLQIDAFRKLVARHGRHALRLPAGHDGTQEAMAIRWTVCQAVLRALATPPRLSCRWGDIGVRGPVGGLYTVVFRDEVARFAESVLRGDINLSVDSGQGRLAVSAVLTRNRHLPRPRQSFVKTPTAEQGSEARR